MTNCLCFIKQEPRASPGTALSAWGGSCSPWHPSLAPVSPHWPNWCCPGAPAAHKLLPSESEGCDELVVPVLAHEEGESRVEKRWEKRENQHENES